MENERRKRLYKDPLFGSPKPKELLKVNGTIIGYTIDRPVFEQSYSDYSVNSIIESNGDPNSGSTFEHEPDLSETDNIMNVVAATNIKFDSQTSKSE